ncbi:MULTISPECIES: arsenite efflux MFS transporter ArsK [Inquilinus]|uniref:MFS family permease n=1 Tax=Inquilinus ginsengisoli TaxID=363840 RepID=A0ABU1JZ53_9PROT|nr:arsenite efflux MFS transporter ArsK [Inquilinus ginsengisoli]MDR6293905.1 MFS family permease [Inquilinus ginsengisoli]
MKPWLVVSALGLTQIIGYGTLYYSFSILAPAMSRDFAWSAEWTFGALSAALLIGGLAAPWVGRRIDRHGAGRVMSVGSVLAAAALVACALAPGRIAFVFGLIAIEVASTFVQYSAAFALLVQLRPQAAQRSITHLTLIAGFASTLFWPITAALHAHLTWQQVYLVFAVLNLAICLPAHAWLSRAMRRPRGPGPATAVATPATPVEGRLHPSRRPIAFALMVTGFALESFVNAAILVHMLPLLAALGLGAASVLVGTLFGPAQVLSRLTNMVFGGGLPQVTLAVISATLMPAAALLLLGTAPWLIGALAFAVVFGLGSGLNSIVQGTLPLELFGSDGYGERLGRVTSVRLVVSSAAPFAFAFLMHTVGTGWALLVTAIFGSVAVLAFLGIVQLSHRRGHGDPEPLAMGAQD